MKANSKKNLSTNFSFNFKISQEEILNKAKTIENTIDNNHLIQKFSDVLLNVIEETIKNKPIPFYDCISTSLNLKPENNNEISVKGVTMTSNFEKKKIVELHEKSKKMVVNEIIKNLVDKYSKSDKKSNKFRSENEKTLKDIVGDNGNFDNYVSKLFLASITKTYYNEKLKEIQNEFISKFNLDETFFINQDFKKSNGLLGSSEDKKVEGLFYEPDLGFSLEKMLSLTELSECASKTNTKNSFTLENKNEEKKRKINEIIKVIKCSFDQKKAEKSATEIINNYNFVFQRMVRAAELKIKNTKTKSKHFIGLIYSIGVAGKIYTISMGEEYTENAKIFKLGNYFTTETPTGYIGPIILLIFIISLTIIIIKLNSKKFD